MMTNNGLSENIEIYDILEQKVPLWKVQVEKRLMQKKSILCLVVKALLIYIECKKRDYNSKRIPQFFDKQSFIAQLEK